MGLGGSQFARFKKVAHQGSRQHIEQGREGMNFESIDDLFYTQALVDFCLASVDAPCLSTFPMSCGPLLPS
jgi:hypothetical protein